jgi:hypothetical protein
MVQPTPDPQWPIFRDYEVKARRGTMRPVDAEDDVAKEWANLPRRTIRGDYVECINDIAVTRRCPQPPTSERTPYTRQNMTPYHELPTIS